MRPLILGLCFAAMLASAASPKIAFTRTFPGSEPAFLEITLEQNGHGVYKEAVDDDSPVAFDLAPAEASEVFRLAEKLDRFSKPLESGLKVAFLGNKTFRWVDGAETHEVKFNYSTNLDAQQLWDWFERMAESEQQLSALEAAAKFEKLGVNKAVLNLEAAWDRKRLVAVAQFLPLLDRIAKSDDYIRMARERAANLADAFRNPVPAAGGADKASKQ